MEKPSTSNECGELQNIDQEQEKPSTSNGYGKLQNVGQEQGSSPFNLVKYLEELTQATPKRILRLCNNLNVALDKSPDDYILNELLNQLFANTGSNFNNGENVGNAETGVRTRQVTVPKKPLLKPAVLVDLNKQERKRAVIQPARFEVNYRNEAVPAMPAVYLNQLQNVPTPPVTESKSREDFVLEWLESNDQRPNSGTTPLDLSEAGPSTAPQVILLNPRDNPLEKMPVKAGPSGLPESANNKIKRVLDEKLVLRLCEMFPNACPNYVRDICDGKIWENFDEVVDIILSDPDHPKRPERLPSPHKEVDPEEQFEIVKALLPDADPTYLRIKCEQNGYDPEKINLFINRKREEKDYPTMKEYLRKQQLSAQSVQYTTKFKVEKFVELVPEPQKTFSDPKRSIQIDKYTKDYIRQYFENRFDKVHKRTIWNVLAENNFKILSTNDILTNIVKSNQIMKSRRKHIAIEGLVDNILVLQEIAYLNHKEEIENFLAEKMNKEAADRKYAKENGLMNSCQCCYDDEVMPTDTFCCPKDHLFCKECIQKSCEVALGEGKTDFQCLSNCAEEFSLHILQNILPPKMFSKLAQKKALAEIKAAGVEELETCPFCDFASIPNASDKVFRCLNPECMKESCRLCREPNHVPLKCDEIEKDEDVKARVYVENKMTEALLRKCWNCQTSFFKEEGCNKMTCTCGAKMCYICGQPVTDYSHFNGMGGDKYHLCPLYSDTTLVNQQNVLGAAEAAKSEVDPSKLKVDPAADVKSHYEARKNVLPREPHLEALANVARIDVHHNHQVIQHGIERLELFEEQQQQLRIMVRVIQERREQEQQRREQEQQRREQEQQRREQEQQRREQEQQHREQQQECREREKLREQEQHRREQQFIKQEHLREQQKRQEQMQKIKKRNQEAFAKHIDRAKKRKN